MPHFYDFTAPGATIRRKIAFEGTRWYQLLDQQNLDEVLALNAALRNAERATSRLWDPGGNGTSQVRVASIPVELAEAWFHNEGINIWRGNDEDWARLLQKLNDRHTWGALRTDAKGRI